MPLEVILLTSIGLRGIDVLVYIDIVNLCRVVIVKYFNVGKALGFALSQQAEILKARRIRAFNLLQYQNSYI